MNHSMDGTVHKAWCRDILLHVVLEICHPRSAEASRSPSTPSTTTFQMVLEVVRVKYVMEGRRYICVERASGDSGAAGMERGLSQRMS